MNSILTQLHQSGHLTTIVAASYRQREEQALAALRRVEQPTYLQQYDLLFRWVSRWLLTQGYALTNYQPHQVLVAVCQQFRKPSQVRELVRCRQWLKYDQGSPTASSQTTLHELLLYFSQGIEYASDLNA
jgi:hypothetical protein